MNGQQYKLLVEGLKLTLRLKLTLLSLFVSTNLDLEPEFRTVIPKSRKCKKYAGKVSSHSSRKAIEAHSLENEGVELSVYIT